MTWTALLLCVIWICATIAFCKTGNMDPFVVALIATLMLGVGYIMIHGR